MSNLLYANFSRMIKNKLFFIGMGFMFFAGSFLCFQQYRQLVGYHAKVNLNSTFFVYTLMIGVISAIFCSLFVGVEYMDGTMRNKIIAGHLFFESDCEYCCIIFYVWFLYVGECGCWHSDDWRVDDSCKKSSIDCLWKPDYSRRILRYLHDD